MLQPVHFVWLGPVPNPATKAIGTPNDFVQRMKGDNVRLWCLDAHAQAFRQLAAPRLKVRSLGHLESKNLALGGRWKARAVDVLHTLLDYSTFVAAKDLLNLLLLHTYGGYTVDTTCSVAPTQDLMQAAVKWNLKWCHIEKAFAKSHSGPHLVRVGNDNALTAFQPGVETVPNIKFGWDVAHGANAVDLPQLDVWAMYSPAKHDAMKVAIQTYVRRAEILGLNHLNKPENDQGVSGHSILQLIPLDANAVNPGQVARDERNLLIGNLISMSVLAGLVSHYGADPVALADNSFRARLHRNEDPVIEQKPQDICPELGIIKTYNGTWR